MEKSSKRPAGYGIVEGVIWQQLLIFFFPILLGTFFQQLYNTADAIIVGKFVGKEALAAVGGGTGTLIAALKFFKSGKIMLLPALIAGVFALAGSAVGTTLASMFSEATLKTLMLVALPCVATFLVFKKDFGSEGVQKREISRRRGIVAPALIGLLIGCYDGMIGPGTGTFMIMGFTALPAVFCSVLGNYLGARYAIRGGSKKIRNMMFLVLGLLFAKMLYELLTR